MGPSLQTCLDALKDGDGGHGDGGELHILERTSLTFLVQNCILAQAPNLTRFKISGALPTLQVNVRLAIPLALRSAVDDVAPTALGSKVQEYDAYDRRRPAQVRRSCTSYDNLRERDSRSTSIHRQAQFRLRPESGGSAERRGVSRSAGGRRGGGCRREEG